MRDWIVEIHFLGWSANRHGRLDTAISRTPDRNFCKQGSARLHILPGWKRELAICTR